MTEPFDDPVIVAKYDAAITALQDPTDVDLRLVPLDAPPPRPHIIEWPNFQYTGIPVRQPGPNGFTAAADVREGAMIAFIPSLDDLTDLAVDHPDAEPVEELHITAVYLGKADEIDVETRTDIIAAMMDLAGRQPLIVANVFGFAVFNPNGPEPAIVANVGGESIDDAHDSVEVTLEEMGIDVEEQHRPWVAHLTLAYPTGDPYEWLTDDLTERTGLITIDKIRVAFGGVITDIPLGVDALSAATAFHLPGKHDQRKHGGLRSMASSEETRIAGKLNKGKKLDPDNPGEARMAGAIGSWTGDTAAPGQAQASSKLFKSDVSHAMQTDPAGDSTGATFARTVAAAPPNAPELHRGMHSVDPGDIPQSGDTFDLGPTSFTRNPKVARDFATPPLSVSRTSDHVVHVKMREGSRSLQIDQHAGDFKREREHVSMGRYRVTSRSDSFDSTTGLTTVSLEIEQIDMDVDVSFTRSQQPSSGFDPGDLN